MKKSVALYVATILILLSGVCYSDEFEYLQNTPETAIVIHQAIVILEDQNPYISDEYPGVPASNEFSSTPVAEHHLLERFTHSILLASVRRMAPIRNKLFQLLSTYRI